MIENLQIRARRTHGHFAKNCIVTILLALIPITTAIALPKEARVPGGIALVPLGAVSAMARPPKAWLDAQPVWVTAEAGQWVAVVGLALDIPGRSHELRILSGPEETAIAFHIREKQYPEQHIRLKDSSKVALSADDEQRASAEIERIRTLKKHWRDTESIDETSGTFLLPTEGRLASRFGLRRFFNGEPRAPHSGLDIAVPRGTPIKASSAGRVLDTGDYFFNGKTVFLDHGNGLITMYCHLDRIDVGSGESIGKGQRIGLAGMTGRASGPHLHWSVVLNGVMVDPALFLKP